eukprot:98358_1
MKVNKNNVDGNVHIDIMDQMHSYLVHSFDSGYRLTKQEIAELTVNNNASNHDVNLSFVRVNQMINAKRKQFHNYFDRQRYSKFVTQTDNNPNTNLSDKDKMENESKNKQLSQTNVSSVGVTYSFSYRFNYWDFKWGEATFDKNNNKGTVIVQPKHPSLKQEMTGNSICKIEISDWINTYDKAKEFMKTDHAKRLRATDIFGYLLHPNQALKDDNVMVIMFYTDYDLLSFKFSETFRKLTEQETLPELIQRHRNYFCFSKILRETVECYGEQYNEYSSAKYYHGISTPVIFNSTIAKFCHPTSTT